MIAMTLMPPEMCRMSILVPDATVLLEAKIRESTTGEADQWFHQA
jgi:hypothetical protein